ncbi:unnamed protein product [Schistosoma turkestanicum]|nr:unnamed protein product [Schistosoma turkestanicum]
MNLSNSSVQSLKNIEPPIDLIWISTLILLGSVSLLGTIGNLLVLGVYIQNYFWPHLHLKYRQVYYNQQLHLLNKKHELSSTIYASNNISNNPSNDSPNKSNHYIVQIHESNEQLFTRTTTGTPTFFILVLACVDLMVCCFIVPLTFYMEYVHLQPPTDIWCKTHAFLNICNIMFSSLLIIAIALERYLTICHPLRRILTMKRAKYLTLGLAIFCIIYGILGALHHSLEVTEDEPNIRQCCDTPEISNATYLQKLTYDILQKGNTASFILCILSVIILYSLILRVVIKTHRMTTTRDWNVSSAINNDITSSYQQTMNMMINNDQSKRVHSNQMKNDILLNDLNNNTDDNHQSIEHLTSTPTTTTAIHRKSITNRIKMNLSIKNITESTLWREIRSASVLFVVAIVYIIVFTPALLTANKLIQFNLLAYNTYYLNNMSNPLIYCFMSNAFRKKLKILLFNSIISSSSTSSSSTPASPSPTSASSPASSLLSLCTCCQFKQNQKLSSHHHQRQQQQHDQQKRLKQYVRARELINHPIDVKQ